MGFTLSPASVRSPRSYRPIRLSSSCCFGKQLNRLARVVFWSANRPLDQLRVSLSLGFGSGQNSANASLLRFSGFNKDPCHKERTFTFACSAGRVCSFECRLFCPRSSCAWASRANFSTSPIFGQIGGGAAFKPHCVEKRPSYNAKSAGRKHSSSPQKAQLTLLVTPRRPQGPAPAPIEHMPECTCSKEGLD